MVSVSQLTSKSMRIYPGGGAGADEAAEAFAIDLLGTRHGACEMDRQNVVFVHL